MNVERLIKKAEKIRYKRDLLQDKIDKLDRLILEEKDKLAFGGC